MSVDWGTVDRSTYQELVRYLHRRVWDVDRAQDLAQETFVRAIEHEPDNPRAWLVSAGRFKAIDAIKVAS